MERIGVDMSKVKFTEPWELSPDEMDALFEM